MFSLILNCQPESDIADIYKTEPQKNTSSSISLDPFPAISAVSRSDCFLSGFIVFASLVKLVWSAFECMKQA